MPYSGPSDRSLPAHVRKLSLSKRRQWIAIFNSTYARTHDDGAAMRAANGVIAREKAITDVLDDDEWWDAQRKAFLKIVEPIFIEIFLAGGEAAATVKPVAVKVAEPAPQYLSIDLDELNDAARRIISTFTDDWWEALSQGARSDLSRAITTSFADGTGVEGVLKKIESLFSPARARAIAVTETTRLFGSGAQETYRQAGLEKWEWQTVRDSFVDSVCNDLQGKQFEMAISFSPSHVNCRCFPKPVVYAEPTAPEVIVRGTGQPVELDAFGKPIDKFRTGVTRVGDAMYKSDPHLFTSSLEAQKHAARLSEEWFLSSTGSVDAVALQQRVREMTRGLHGSPSAFFDAESLSAYAKLSARELAIVESYSTNQYAYTQQLLKGKPQTLYRGLNWNAGQEPAAIKDLKLKPGQESAAVVNLNPLSSFSPSRETADLWAREMGGTRGYIIEVKVPADRIFLIDGNLGDEMVVVGGDLVGTVTRVL